MIESAWKKKYKKIWLTVFSDNTRALVMYKNLGFKIEGIFMNDEMVNKKYRHVVSMALFHDDKKIDMTRKKILDKL
jgi:RimJ/RimL family protein N-acetyltransferase